MHSLSCFSCSRAEQGRSLAVIMQWRAPAVWDEMCVEGSLMEGSECSLLVSEVGDKDEGC